MVVDEDNKPPKTTHLSSRRSPSSTEARVRSAHACSTCAPGSRVQGSGFRSAVKTKVGFGILHPAHSGTPRRPCMAIPAPCPLLAHAMTAAPTDPNRPSYQTPNPGQ